MVRIRLVALAALEQRVLTAIGHEGLIQLTEPDRKGAMEWTSRSLSSERQLNALRMTQIEQLRNRIGIPILEDLASTIERNDIDLNATIGHIRTCSDELKEQETRLRARLRELEEPDWWRLTYRETGIETETTDSSFLWLRTGTVTEDGLEALKREVGPTAVIEVLPESEGRRPIVVMTSPKHSPTLEASLHNVGFEHHLIPTRQTVLRIESGEIERLRQDLKHTQERIEKLREEALVTLGQAHEQLKLDRRMIEAKARLLDSPHTFLMEGWLPAVDLPMLEKCVDKSTEGRYLLEAVPAEEAPEEQVPTVLRHGWLLRPFTMLVTAYGIPAYGELVPTLFLALTYLVMFGLMFGDWGHGLVLIGLGAYAVARKTPTWARDLGVLLMAGGTSSVVFGIIYGSCFGIEGLKRHALWHDPLEGNPAQLMLGTIAFGAIVLSLGVLLNVANKIRRGQVREAILNKFGILGLVFYWGIIATIALEARASATDSSVYWIAAVIGIPLGTWALREPAELLSSRRSGHEHAGGLGGAFASSVVEAFDAVLAFFANSISFVRLAAYAMSHAALLMAMITLAEQLESIPTVGPILHILVLGVGNLVVIALEGLVAAVQGLRLQYYEFFGKFYSGTGYAFSPFRL